MFKILLHLISIIAILNITYADANKLEDCIVYSDSMSPTIKNGDTIYIDFNYYKTHTLSRGDIVVYQPPHTDTLYIHRCIALPGDLFDINNDKVFLNNHELIEKYATGITNLKLADKNHNILGSVPEDVVVILGDNRENCIDSRIYGYVPKANIKGKYISSLNQQKGK